MRKVVVIIISIILLALAGSWCMSQLQGGTGSMKSPEATAKSAIMSLESLQPAKTQAYCTPVPGQLMANRLSRMYLNIKELDIQNLAVMLVSKEGSSARVQAVYDMVLTSHLGAVSTEHRLQILKLIEQDGKWYVNEVF